MIEQRARVLLGDSGAPDESCPRAQNLSQHFRRSDYGVISTSENHHEPVEQTAKRQTLRGVSRRGAPERRRQAARRYRQRPDEELRQVRKLDAILLRQKTYPGDAGKLAALLRQLLAPEFLKALGTELGRRTR